MLRHHPRYKQMNEELKEEQREAKGAKLRVARLEEACAQMANKLTLLGHAHWVFSLHQQLALPQLPIVKREHEGRDDICEDFEGEPTSCYTNQG